MPAPWISSRRFTCRWPSTAIKNDLEVRLKPIPLPADLKKYAVLGMQLADVTPELKSAYDLYFDRGALILDPGKDSDRLKIGRARRRLLSSGWSATRASAAFASSSTRSSPRPPVKTPQRTRFTGFASFTASARSMVRREQYAVSETHEGRPQAVANRVGPAHARAGVISNDGFSSRPSCSIWPTAGSAPSKSAISGPSECGPAPASDGQQKTARCTPPTVLYCVSPSVLICS